MALIELTGKYAVGAHRYAIVDDDMADYLSQWHWKAKPNGNGNNVYAVRNTKMDGKCVTLRMHRIVAGMGRDNPLEVDHDNHNSLDNRRVNLKPATRSQNGLNRRLVISSGTCVHCRRPISRLSKVRLDTAVMTCQSCVASDGSTCAVHFSECQMCGAGITSRNRERRFCSDACRCRHRYEAGYRAPHRAAKPGIAGGSRAPLSRVRRGPLETGGGSRAIAHRDISLAVDF